MHFCLHTAQNSCGVRRNGRNLLPANQIDKVLLQTLRAPTQNKFEIRPLVVTDIWLSTGCDCSFLGQVFCRHSWGAGMKKKILTAILAATATVFFFLPIPSRAQQATTSLNGVVTDPSGGVLPGASVTITRNGTGQVLTTTTNARGEYQFSQLNPGTWTVTVTPPALPTKAKSATCWSASRPPFLSPCPYKPSRKPSTSPRKLRHSIRLTLRLATPLATAPFRTCRWKIATFQICSACNLAFYIWAMSIDTITGQSHRQCQRRPLRSGQHHHRRPRR